MLQAPVCHLFFKPCFGRRSKPQQEWLDSDEPSHLLPCNDMSRDVPQAGEERGGFSRAGMHMPRGLCTHPALSFLCWHQGLEVTAATSQVGQVLLPAAPLDSGLEDFPLHTTPAAASPAHARCTHCQVQLPRCCPWLSRHADTGSKPRHEEQHVVSAHYDASLRLYRCHSTAWTSVSPELLPWQEKLCREVWSFSLSFSLCCQAPHVPAQRR